jgi:2,3-dihydroxybenzoate-AMP ligase
LLSGGTTGYPKMIPRTHDDYAYNFRRSGEVAGFGEDTRFLVALPIAHNFPLGSPGFLGALERGGAAILARDPSVATCFPLIEREAVTHAAAVPTVAGRWIEADATERARLRSLRVLQVGGARLPETVAARVRPALGCALQQVFGMAEGLLNFTRLDDDDELVLTTQGVPMSADDELRVVDEDGSDVAPGSPGELLVRGPYTLRGYYAAEHHNARCFTPDGYYRSGDIVRRLPSGHLVVDGRIKDIVNRGGEKISAEDVENHLLAHPLVLEAAVVAMPDAIFGERACAFVVLRDSARTLGLEELVTHFVSRGLAKGMTPERVELVERLPLTNVGKIDKKALRERITALLLGAVEA